MSETLETPRHIEARAETTLYRLLQDIAGIQTRDYRPSLSTTVQAGLTSCEAEAQWSRDGNESGVRVALRVSLSDGECYTYADITVYQHRWKRHIELTWPDALKDAPDYTRAVELAREVLEGARGERGV